MQNEEITKIVLIVGGIIAALALASLAFFYMQG